jgi:hypothetical protein
LGAGSTTLAVYGPGGSLIESTNLTFLTNGDVNTGQFVGFVETTPIGSFTLSGNFVGIVATPLPAALWFLGPGLAGLAAVRRRFRK